MVLKIVVPLSCLIHIPLLLIFSSGLEMTILRFEREETNVVLAKRVSVSAKLCFPSTRNASCETDWQTEAYIEYGTFYQ